MATILAIFTVLMLLMVVHSISNRDMVAGADINGKSWPVRMFLRWWYRMEAE